MKDQWDSAAYSIRLCARTRGTFKKAISTAVSSNEPPAPTLLEVHPFSQLQNENMRLR